MPRRLEIIGQRFGRLVVEAYLGQSNWLCRCDCGNTTVTKTVHLRTGHTSSCGCFRRDNTALLNLSHGRSHSMTHERWQGMLARCYNKNHKSYYRYGGRGIKVCQRWHSYENFLADMGEAPGGSILNRIDNDGDYEPGNCEWTTYRKSAQNTRRNINVTFNGITQCLMEWARATGIKYATLLARFYRGDKGDRLFRQIT